MCASAIVAQMGAVRTRQRMVAVTDLRDTGQWTASVPRTRKEGEVASCYLDMSR